jgi:hypothetical protein
MFILLASASASLLTPPSSKFQMSQTRRFSGTSPPSPIHPLSHSPPPPFPPPSPPHLFPPTPACACALIHSRQAYPALRAGGVTLVATSNSSPHTLYLKGLNREVAHITRASLLSHHAVIAESTLCYCNRL